MSIFYTGNTGKSTGPHLDMRVYNPATGNYEDPSAYTEYLTVGDDKSAFNFGITSPRGMRTLDGVTKMHEGIDYATPVGTALNVNGNLLSTWNDEGSGGIMSQYVVDTNDGIRELLLLHGNDSNAITGTGAVTDYDIDNLPIAVVTGDRSGAKTKAKAYKDMSKSEMNAAYDAMRSDPAKAELEGMKMHRAFFNK
jgi:hypothetical protein